MITGVDQLDQMMHGRERRKVEEVEEVERRQGDVTEGRQQEWKGGLHQGGDPCYDLWLGDSGTVSMTEGWAGGGRVQDAEIVIGEGPLPTGLKPRLSASAEERKRVRCRQDGGAGCWQLGEWKD